MILHNATHLETRRLEALFRHCAAAWPLDGLDVRVRYTRSSPFSGLCVYQTGRIHVNIGRRNRYPYAIRTHIARAKTTRRAWWRPMYVVHATDAYQLALFIFLHELYHWLIRKARRNTRQKEGRCDRFAVRALVDRFGAQVFDHEGRAVSRDTWDFQDLDAFVARALPTRKRPSPQKPGAAIQTATAAMRALNAPATQHSPAGVGAVARQLTLFGEWPHNGKREGNVETSKRRNQRQRKREQGTGNRRRARRGVCLQRKRRDGMGAIAQRRVDRRESGFPPARE